MKTSRSASLSYAERTHHSPYRIVRYAHRRRFELLISEALATRPSTMLDYGAGDAEMLLTMLKDPRCDPSMTAIAFEPHVEGYNEHMSHRDDSEPTERITLAEKLEEVPDQSCDVISCGGVLEHLTISERYRCYDFARRVLRPGGHLIVDVPIELGPAILIKNVGRRVLKGDEREYTMRETLSAAFGLTVFDPHRYDPSAGNEFIVSHKGFDHRLLKKELAGQGFDVIKSVHSPVTWLPAALANQEVIYTAVISGSST